MELNYQVFLLDYSRIAFKQIMELDMANIQNEREKVANGSMQ